MIKYLFWDFDGVIVNSEMIYFNLWKQILPSNLSFSPRDLHGKTNNQFLDNLRYKFSEKQKKDLVALKEQKILSIISNESIDLLLKELIIYSCKEKIINYIISNNSKEVICEFLKNNNIEKYFNKIIVPSSKFIPKPDPAMYIYASSGIEKSKVLVIEDSELGITSARSANLKVVKFDYNFIEKSVNKILQYFN